MCRSIVGVAPARAPPVARALDPVAPALDPVAPAPLALVQAPVARAQVVPDPETVARTGFAAERESQIEEAPL